MNGGRDGGVNRGRDGGIISGGVSSWRCHSGLTQQNEIFSQ